MPGRSQLTGGAPGPQIGPLTCCAVIVKLRDVISLIPSLGTSRSGHFERGARAEANPPDTTQGSQPPRSGTAAWPQTSTAARRDPAAEGLHPAPRTAAQIRPRSASPVRYGGIV